MKILSFMEALKPAYRPVKPKPDKLNNFNQALEEFKKNTDEAERESHNVNPIIDFLKQIAYGDDKYKVNTYVDVDIAISEDEIPKVLIEVKRPEGNEGQMVTTKDLNRKALWESLLYYMRETDPPKKKHKQSNLLISHIVITNNKEWFIINAEEIEKIAKFPDIESNYRNIIRDRKASIKTTERFYDEVKSIIRNNKLLEKIKFTHIDFGKDYSRVELQNIYKLFTPRHLLNDYGANDSNTLNKKFYEELLHILGLVETDTKTKLIQRKSKDERVDGDGSFLENTISKLKIEYDLTDETKEDEKKLFEIALELNITWLNRILFLKLLEARLDSIHNKKYKKFLTAGIIKDFDILNTLFFEVLAIKKDKRDSLSIENKEHFKEIPYLNSSLFEPTELEKKYLRISNLKDNLKLKVFTSTKIDGAPKELNSLEYLLEFLNAYNFSSDEALDFDDGNDSLINSAVLGLIFEKINGYKDGSFFTPAFITNYMTKESIRKKVIDKFNEDFDGLKVNDFDELMSYCEGEYYKKDFIKKANDIINSITILDPAVGSGHFLVSALNEILVIKSKLMILEGLNGYQVDIENDELYIQNNEGLFKYCKSKNGKFLDKVQNMQKKIFYEKQQIIERQLFGVDINPNSVKITRLRLWIELLKHSYYENDKLITLPNIDINIKCGNSLISKFPLQDNDTKNKILKDKINKYKQKVKDYKNEKNKNYKRDIEQEINNIKNGFKKGLHESSPIMIQFNNALKKYVSIHKYDGLFEELILVAVKNNFGVQQAFFNDEAVIQKAKEQTKEKMLQKLNKLHQTIEGHKNDKIYKNSFEWRFEFPEVLNDEGDFVGFDIIIGNPPYIGERGHKEIFRPLKEIFKEQYEAGSDLFYFFFMKSIDLLKENGNLGFITTNYFLTADGAIKLREELKKRTAIYSLINFNEMKIFESATGQHNIITMFKKTRKILDTHIINVVISKNATLKNLFIDNEDIENFRKKSNELFDGDKNYIRVSKRGSSFKNLFYKMTDDSKNIGEICSINVGFKTGTDKISKKDIKEVYDGVVPDEIKLNNGVFILNEKEYNTIKPEEDLVFKCYKNSDIDEYYSTSWRNLYVIRTHKDTDIEKYPNIKNHLEVYRKILEYKITERGELSPWYANYRTRDNELFTNKNKIIFPYRSHKNIFSYSDNEYFASGDILYLRQKDKSFDIKYLLALLNSKLYYIWLYYKGKRKGETLELYKTPISQIPIKKISKEEQQPYVKIVDEIITLKKENKDTKVLERQIDKMIYGLYGLSKDEIKIIEQTK